MLIIQWLLCWSLIMSTIVAISARIPLYTWISLEVNTIAFIPIILDPNKPEAVRGAIKYFFIQAYASLLFLAGPILRSFPQLTICIAILIKLGVSPFHNWYPSVIKNLNWKSNLLLSTWQKIAPLCILRENRPTPLLLVTLRAVNAIVGGAGGLIQTEIRPLLAFSSIGHIGWMMYALTLNNFITFIYFLSYFLHLLILVNILDLIKIYTAKELSSSKNNPLSIKIALAFLLLSLGGLPPLLGFLPKLIVLSYSPIITLPPVFLILGSYINIYYYMTIIWRTFIENPQPLTTSFKISSSTLGIASITSFFLISLL